MQDCFNLVYYIFSKFFDFFFNFYIFDGVSIGMILIVIILFGIMINWLLIVPRGSKGGSND